MNKQIKILIVDDDFINLKLLQSMLKKSDFTSEIVEAKNGLEALNILKNQPGIGLILLDIKMPVMDGIEFLTNLGSMPSIRKVPVIVLTTDETKRRESFDQGAFDFLVKPIREAELNKKILKILELS